MAQITRFVREDAQRYSDGALLASSLIPEGEQPPFQMDWASVEVGATTREELHKVKKVFIFMTGTGTAIVGEERIAVSPGLIVWVPREVPHHLENDGKEPLQLTVIKWDPKT